MKEKVLILNTKRASFTKNGETVEFTSTTIARLVEPTSNFVGYVLEEISGKAQDFDTISKYVNKLVNIEFDLKKVDRKNYRCKLTKIEDITL